MQIVARFKDDGRKQHNEENCGTESFFTLNTKH